MTEASATLSGLAARCRRLYTLAPGEDGRTRVPHPGDILYWVTCLGAACLLLLAAT